MSSYSIQGTLRLTSPLHVSSFEAGWRIDDQRQILRGDVGKPLTRTMRTVFAGADRALSETPLMYGNGFRGRFRRFARQHIQKVTGPISLDTYHGLSCGAVSGRPSKDSITISGSAKARDHVYMGLYGGSPAMYQSTYRAFDLYPVTEATIQAGLVPKRYADIVPTRYVAKNEARPARPDELLTCLDFIRVDDLLRFRDPDAHLMVKDHDEALAAWAAKNNENRAAVAASKAAVKEAAAAKGKKGKADAVEKVSKNTLDAMSAIEVVVPGVDMFFRVDLAERVQDHHIGLMLMCVADLVKADALGGWTRAGLGTFKADLHVYEDSDLLSPLLTGEGRNAHLHEDLVKFETAAADALAAIDPRELDGFFEEAA